MAHNEGNMRINGGEYFWYKAAGGSWADFGIVLPSEFDDSRSVSQIRISGGYIVPVVKDRTMQLVIELAETDKTHLDLVDTLSGKTCALWIYDGVVDTNNVGLYVPQALVTVAVKKKDGDNPQKITVTAMMKRQTAIVSCADTDLPSSEAPKPPAGTYTGNNKFYQWISWAVT